MPMDKNVKQYFILMLGILGLLLIFMNNKIINNQIMDIEYYNETDFSKIKKIDIHCHVNSKRLAFMEQAANDNFQILTINTDAPIGVTIEEQQELALFQQKTYPARLEYLTSFSLQGWENDNWCEKTIKYIDESIQKGAIGVKVWKNIGMVEKNKDGKFIMIDDPKLDQVFNYLEKNGIPLCGHLGEPRNCWLPVEKMTVNNDKSYFKDNPEYHMYLHPEYPSYEDQIIARNNMLDKHPDLKFMGAHLGSLEWSVDELAKHFDKYENLTVDMAARICHIQKQTQEDWQKVHDFFIKYQDRIIYGTDEGDYKGSETNPFKLKENVHLVWTRDWKFLTTNEVMTSWEVNGEFSGLKLPKEVIDKIYYKNAVKLFPEFKN